jgi:hypothetical protein
VTPENWNEKQEAVNSRWFAIRDRLIALGIPVPSAHLGHMSAKSWEQLLDKAERGAAAEAAPPASPATGHTPWHEGTHAWAEHDGYSRHQHSLNGALTIHPNDTGLHFKAGSLGCSHERFSG